jgi:hypothetical protein
MVSWDVLARAYVTNLRQVGVNRYEDLPDHTRESLSRLLDQASWASGKPPSQFDREVVEALFHQKEEGYTGDIKPDHVLAALAGIEDTEGW